ncbi:FtsX-like permease family protein [Terrilactibacillus sp. BCM23-1]|uniref:Cell division protein FtsX n=1 Tax=Terrilactibacillus tamarindi TaxID=2599694 RepID=A0A6N8CNM8_9BACI|nr:permease-like cell division protein FtsX [Terrilactibacillus tamarindi]MTT31581.1 FtsX-like permease family protein [Terrilactibacillus tamarindi]
MKLRTLGRHARESLKNLGRNGWMTFASISAVAVALVLVGLFLSVMMNLNKIAGEIESNVEVRVYIDRTATQAQQDQLKQSLKSIGHVQSIAYQSREKGLKNLINSLGEGNDQSAFSSVKNENPLPDAFILKTEKPEQTITVANQVKTLPYVYKVNYGKGTVEKLFKTVRISRNVGIVLIIGLLFTSIFLIANTIKLTIVARRREIEIMKLVGATNAFVRWPYFLEGLLIGVIGSIIPIILVNVGYKAVYEKFSDAGTYSTFFIKLIPYPTMALYLSLLLVVIGAGIGVWGSVTSIRKFLRV